MSVDQFSTNAQTMLSAAITSPTATSISVSNGGSPFPSAAQFRILIDSELMLVTAGAGSNIWTVTREIEGSTAATHSSGAAVTQVATAAALDNRFLHPAVCDGRLTLTSGTPITTSDVTGATTIYFTPYKGNYVCVYNGTIWKLYAFSEISLVLGTLTSGLPYDVFIYDNSGTLTLELAAWTSGTARATALALQDGVYVKSGATSRRYLGTFYTTATTTTEDSAKNRLVWNYYHRVMRKLKVNLSGTTWTYTAAGVWRAVDSNTAVRVATVTGLQEDPIYLLAIEGFQGSTGTPGIGSTGICVNNTNANNADIVNRGQGNLSTSVNAGCVASLMYYPAIGYNFYQQVEYNEASSVVTFLGSGNGNSFGSGMTGWVPG